MSLLLHGDCLEHMKDLDDDSIDLIFCDLPYATDKYSAVSCKWNTPIDLDKFWIEVMRIKKLNTPIFMTTTTKFGVELINSAPKKCHFRYDIVWVKSAPVGFLSAKKMPMRKHEMVYVFYEKLPYYDLSSHKHKFIKEKESVRSNNSCYGGLKSEKCSKYDPPLPTTIVKEETTEKYIPPQQRKQTSIIKQNEYNHNEEQIYNAEYLEKKVDFKGRNGGSMFEPPLPTSIVKEELCKYDVNKNTYGGGKEGRIKISKDKKDHQQKYDPPLPTSIVKEELDEKYKNKGGLYSKVSRNGLVKNEPHYDPPLPTTIVKEEPHNIYDFDPKKMIDDRPSNVRTPTYDPPLPTTMLEIKSTKGKHSTEKPVALMSWILKYYSKEGDTILDPTMGSGSTGVACKEMKRNFIGIEMNDDIFDVAYKRINE